MEELAHSLRETISDARRWAAHADHRVGRAGTTTASSSTASGCSTNARLAPRALPRPARLRPGAARRRLAGDLRRLVAQRPLPDDLSELDCRGARPRRPSRVVAGAVHGAAGRPRSRNRPSGLGGRSDDDGAPDPRPPRALRARRLEPATCATWLRDLGRAGSSWGFEMVKLDFLYLAAVEGVRHDPQRHRHRGAATRPRAVASTASATTSTCSAAACHCCLRSGSVTATASATIWRCRCCCASSASRSPRDGPASTGSGPRRGTSPPDSPSTDAGSRPIPMS